MKLGKVLAAGLLFLVVPELAHAHAAEVGAASWREGFVHPLFGWDHLLAMLAVGLWAAQQRGRATWLIPVTFVAVMAVGGVVGASGISLPGVETAILISVAVFGVLVVHRAQYRSWLSLGLVGFFAFFHGFAHGAEMPGAAHLPSFGAGFMLATLLLHGVGIATARVAVFAAACLVATSAAADDPAPQDPMRLPEVVVEGRSDSLVGVAESASQGTVGAKQIEDRPLLRPGEILETVPGLIVTQHSGDGKANQYFLRGFNLDHGTDFATKVNGVPVNLPTHGHGQGYTDLNFMIPELVRTASYKKGVYYADEGDFSSAGAANLEYFDVLPSGFAQIEGGSFQYFRSVVAASPEVAGGHLLAAGEVQYADGPWKEPENFLKGNAVLRYSTGTTEQGWNLTAMGYKADWNSTDQIARRAVALGDISRFGTLDDSDGGNSQRYSVSAGWHRNAGNQRTELLAYGFYYDLDLFSNFTYALDQVNGDQFEQRDKRWVAGGSASHSWILPILGFETENTFGLQLRNDAIRNGLFNTTDRHRRSTTRRDTVNQFSVAPYFETREQWSPWFRSIAGVRCDLYNFKVDSDLPANSGGDTARIASPKLALIFGPWAQTEFYANGGLGFHSNDGRGSTIHVDPVTGDPVSPVDPLVRTYGAELGLRTTLIPGLQSTVAFWGLDIDSELIFVGDAGTTEAGRPSRRYGLELANYYTPTEWLAIDADFAFTRARFTNDDPAGDHIPGAPDAVIAAGATVHDLWGGFFGGPRVRYFGPRPLVEDNSVRSDGTVLLSARLGYQFGERWTLSAEIFNLMNAKDDDITYYYSSRLPGEAPGPEEDGGHNDIHFHPVEKTSVRVAFTGRF